MCIAAYHQFLCFGQKLAPTWFRTAAVYRPVTPRLQYDCSMCPPDLPVIHKLVGKDSPIIRESRLTTE